MSESTLSALCECGHEWGDHLARPPYQCSHSCKCDAFVPRAVESPIGPPVPSADRRDGEPSEYSAEWWMRLAQKYSAETEALAAALSLAESARDDARKALDEAREGVAEYSDEVERVSAILVKLDGDTAHESISAHVAQWADELTIRRPSGRNEVGRRLDCPDFGHSGPYYVSTAHGTECVKCHAARLLREDDADARLRDDRRSQT